MSSLPNRLPVVLQHLLLRELRTLRRELEAYPDERLLWAMPPGCPNSAGTLALHLAGNLRHYFGAHLGGTSYVRNRPEEFAARDIPRAAILDQLAEAEAAIGSALPSLSEEQMARIADGYRTYVELKERYRSGEF